MATWLEEVTINDVDVFVVTGLVDDAGEGVIVGSDGRGRPREVINTVSVVLLVATTTTARCLVVIDIVSFDPIIDRDARDAHKGH